MCRFGGPQAQWHLRRLIFSQMIDHQIQPCLRNDIQQGRQDLKQGSPDSSDSWMLAAQVKEKTKRGEVRHVSMLSKPPGWHSHHCERLPDCVATGHAPCGWLCFQAAVRRWGKSSVTLGPQYIAMLNRKMMISY